MIVVPTFSKRKNSHDGIVAALIARAKFFLTGRNLITVTNYLGPDPEVDSNLTLGVNPNTKQYTVGVELTF